uniref:Uncharacterized protein n=1 Tax=Romanomermis culicivorax TaxID=13658 RepID=A0A915JNE6_ROMCU
MSKDTKRTPGLLKVEYEGTAICCLAAKTYMAVDKVTGQQKVSSKGLMKKLLCMEKTLKQYLSG